MKKFTKKELQEQADKFMKAHKVDSFFATEDGNFFHPKDESLAYDHNFKNVKGEVFEFGSKKKKAESADITPGSHNEDVDRHGEEPTEEEIKAAEKKAADAAKAKAEKKAADEAKKLAAAKKADEAKASKSGKAATKKAGSGSDPVQ